LHVPTGIDNLISGCLHGISNPQEGIVAMARDLHTHPVFMWMAGLLLLCASQAVGEDVAEIRAVTKEFTQAITSGDPDAIGKHVAAGVDAAKFLDSARALADANRRLKEASVARFGTSGKDLTFEAPMGNRLEEAPVTVDGDIAMIKPTGGETRWFVKIKGAWKIDLRSKTARDLADATGAFEKDTVAVNHIIEAIKAGKYKTAQDAAVALRQNIVDAVTPAPADAGRSSEAAEVEPTRLRVVQGGDGMLKLWAHDASDIGSCKIRQVNGVQCITGWENPKDAIRWAATIKSYRDPGIYEVMVTYACDPDAGGTDYSVEVGQQRVIAKTTATGEAGGWPQFNSECIGSVRLDRPADIDLIVRPLKKTGRETMHLRSVVLKAVTAEQVATRMKSASPVPLAGSKNGPTICVDVSELPDLEEWAFGAREYCRKWYAPLDELLHTDGFTSPRVFGMRVIKDPRSIGYNDNGGVINITAFTTAGNTIVIFHTWALPNDYGMEIHEMTHVLQKYPKNVFWVVEGISDYIRYYVVEPGSKAAAFNPTTAHYRDGYQAASAFFNWMEKKYGHGPHGSVISTLNNALRQGTFRLELFKEVTGKDVDELWDEFRQILTQKNEGAR
jgi:hypothetical protein